MPLPLIARRQDRFRRFAGMSLLVLLAGFGLGSLLGTLLSPVPAAQPRGGPPSATGSIPVVVSRPPTPIAQPVTSETPDTAASVPTSSAASTRLDTAEPSSAPSVRASRTTSGQEADLPSPSMTPTAVSTLSSSVEASGPAPTVPYGASPSVPYFGVSMEQVDAQHGLAQAAAAEIGVIRVSELNWDRVEPVRTEPPTYLWDKMAGLDQELINAAQAGLRVDLLVLDTPVWARQVTSHACSAIKEEALDEFAQFLQAAVVRYSLPPFSIHDWELYNEPDVDPALVSSNGGIGCWGDVNDPFYGGRAFGRMLLAAYPAIKRADAGARVIFGGLLLDRPDTLPSTFLAGALEAGAGQFFDLLAFHAYTFYFSPSVPESDRRSDMPWSSRGGVVAGKAGFLRDVMRQYSISRPLILNEAGLGWYGSKPSPAEFPAAQADYVTKLYNRGRALDLTSVIWYGWDAPGWRHMALLNADLSPKPGAAALSLAVKELGSAEFVGSTVYEGIEVYAFRRASDRLEVVWSADGQAHSFRVPLRSLRNAFDGLGEPLSHTEESGEAILIVERPAYLVLAP